MNTVNRESTIDGRRALPVNRKSQPSFEPEERSVFNRLPSYGREVDMTHPERQLTERSLATNVDDRHSNMRRRSSSQGEPSIFERNSIPRRPMDSSIAVLHFDGSGDLELFLKRFQSIASFYSWNERETLFRLEQSVLDNAQYVMQDAPPPELSLSLSQR